MVETTRIRNCATHSVTLTPTRHCPGCLAANDKAIQFAIDELKLTVDEAAKQQVGFSDRAMEPLIPPKTVDADRAMTEFSSEQKGEGGQQITAARLNYRLPH